MNEETQSIIYKMSFPDGKLIEFPIRFDKNSCTFIPETEITPPSWADLEYKQCENCTLQKSSSPYCPIALNLTPILGLCSDVTSYQTLKLEVVTAERTIIANTSMQRAMRSILGLIMATSACPHTEYLKPMAYFHLPLANNDETIYRSASMYFLAQYFLRRDGLEYSLELEKLDQLYLNLQTINRALIKRLREAVNEDATVNAVILLELLSQTVTWSIESGLEDFRYLFRSFGIKP